MAAALLTPPHHGQGVGSQPLHKQTQTLAKELQVLKPIVALRGGVGRGVCEWAEGVCMTRVLVIQNTCSLIVVVLRWTVRTTKKDGGGPGGGPALTAFFRML